MQACQQLLFDKYNSLANQNTTENAIKLMDGICQKRYRSVSQQVASSREMALLPAVQSQLETIVEELAKSNAQNNAARPAATRIVAHICQTAYTSLLLCGVCEYCENKLSSFDDKVLVLTAATI
jgi:methionine synthase II (cobalamin-independent)